VPTYPYISGQAAVLGAFAQLKKNFPPKVDADYLKRFAIAPANESYIISILRFLDLIDGDEGARRDENVEFFYGTDEAFQSGLEKRVREAYANLFDEMGNDALTADKTALAHWFRTSDKTSDLVGQRQASTFQTLAALAGHGDVPTARTSKTKKPAEATSAAKKPPVKESVAPKGSSKKANDDATKDRGGNSEQPKGSDVGLTVRIEVNLPPGGDAKTYDAIFASIKKHLMS
jgi:hypothetical protein